MSSQKWLIPATVPTTTRDVTLRVPDSDEWEALARGALALLLSSANYEQTGTITPDDAVQVFIAPLTYTFTNWG